MEWGLMLRRAARLGGQAILHRGQIGASGEGAVPDEGRLFPHRVDPVRAEAAAFLAGQEQDEPLGPHRLAGLERIEAVQVGRVGHAGGPEIIQERRTERSRIVGRLQDELQRGEGVLAEQSEDSPFDQVAAAFQIRAADPQREGLGLAIRQAHLVAEIEVQELGMSQTIGIENGRAMT